jgi:hypothetical protein
MKQKKILTSIASLSLGFGRIVLMWPMWGSNAYTLILIGKY